MNLGKKKEMEKVKIEKDVIAFRIEMYQESPLVLGFGPAEAFQPNAANTLKQKDHLLAEERGGGGMEGWKDGGTLYRGIWELCEWNTGPISTFTANV